MKGVKKIANPILRQYIDKAKAHLNVRRYQPKEGQNPYYAETPEQVADLVVKTADRLGLHAVTTEQVRRWAVYPNGLFNAFLDKFLDATTARHTYLLGGFIDYANEVWASWREFYKWNTGATISEEIAAQAIQQYKEYKRNKYKK